MLFIEASNHSYFIGLLGFITVITIIALSYYYSKKQVIIRFLKKLPDSSIRNISQNKLTKITGKALHVKEPLIAPLSKRKCVFYTMKIEKETSDEDSSTWETLVHEENVQEFFIEQNGEFLIIKPTQKPKNYKSHFVTDRETSSGTFNNPSPKFEALLKYYNIKSTNFFGFNKALRYTEGIIEIGEMITVAGIAKWKNLKEPIEGYPYSKIAVLESTDKQKLIITDLPNMDSKRKM